MEKSVFAELNWPRWSVSVLTLILFFVLYIPTAAIGVHYLEQFLIQVLQLGKANYYQKLDIDAKYILFNYSINFCVSFLFFYLFCRFILKKSFAELGLKANNKLIEFSLGVILGFVLIGFGFYVLKTSGYLFVTSYSFDFQNLILLAIMFLLVSVSEELMSRGILIQIMQWGFGKYGALIITSVIFGALHLFNDHVNWLSFLSISLAGILLGISYIQNYSLYFPIGLHFAWNYFQGPIFGFEVSGHKMKTYINQILNGPDIWTGGEFGFEGSVLVIPILVIGIFISYQYFKTKTIA